MNSSRGPLLAALAVSTAIHAAVFAGFPGTRPATVKNGGSGPLIVGLAKEQAEPPREAAAPPPKPAPNRHAPAAKSPPAKNLEDVTKPPEQEADDTPPDRPATPSQQPAPPRTALADRAAERAPEKVQRPETDTSSTNHVAAAANGNAALQQQLSQALTRHFHYPRLAQRRGWEGRVLLELEIAPDGRVGAAEIIHGSGHSVLDRAAIRAANRIGRLPDAGQWLNGTTRRFKLPVIYQLREG